MWEGAGDRTETVIFWPHCYDRQRCVFLVLQGCSTGGPRPTLLGASFLYCILSASSLDPNSSGPQAPLAWCGFPYHNSSPTGPWLPSWLRYIIIQHPYDRPLDIWNRMLNRHQAEITVMQFTGHSLLVHQSMSVPWEFFSSSRFINQFLPTRFPLITAITMCHLLPVHHLGMAFLARSKGQNMTYVFVYIVGSISWFTSTLFFWKKKKYSKYSLLRHIFH